ncbi:hypothetical protein XJ18_13980 [Bacillus pumilus]|nr:hypothetical protein XJ18_13980 [Bacillus pumilus]
MCRHHHKKTSIQLVNVKKFVQMLYYEAKRIFMEDEEKTCSPMMGGMSFFVMEHGAALCFTFKGPNYYRYEK